MRPSCAVVILLALCVLAISAASFAYAVSTRQQCILGALAEGRRSNAETVEGLYTKYFDIEALARQSFGGAKWKRAPEDVRLAHRARVKRFIIYTLVPRFKKASETVEFLSDSGSKVIGIMRYGGENKQVTWFFRGSCKFSNVCVMSDGCLTSLIGKEMQENTMK